MNARAHTQAAAFITKSSFQPISHSSSRRTATFPAPQCAALHHVAAHRNTLQRNTATRCVLGDTISPARLLRLRGGTFAQVDMLQRNTATYCNTLQHTALRLLRLRRITFAQVDTHCNILQHTTTHYKTLQYTAARLLRRRRGTFAQVNTLKHNTATQHCNTLQHTAKHCSTPAVSLKGRLRAVQHTATHCNIHCNTL